MVWMLVDYMSAIRREKEWLKETIWVEEGKTRLGQYNNYGWTLENYLNMLGNKMECSECNYFMGKI